MLPKNPLEMPEITNIVSSSLKSKDLASCLRVSKTWYTLFLPHLWKSIKAGSTSENRSRGPFSRIGPHPADIYRHRHLIHSLTMYGDLAGLDKYNYPNLRHLVVNSLKDMDYYERMIFLDLTDMFPLTVSLDIRSVRIEAATWLALSAHSCITTLKLQEIIIAESAVQDFWRACMKLECLELTMVFITSEVVPDDMMFVRLRRLYLWDMMGLEGAKQLSLVFKCPELKEFGWSMSKDDGEDEEDEEGNDEDNDESDAHPILKNAIPDGCWPHLNTLTIAKRLRDADVASILNGVSNGHGGLIELALCGCSLFDQSSMALESHFSTLVDLDLKDCPGTLFQDILCSCPRLEILDAGCVLVRDVVGPRPWVCHQLRDLMICLRLGEGEQDLQHKVFERLSRLIHLESLTMICADGTHNQGYVEFRLENGLGQLASLQRLRTLTFSGWCPQLSMDEVVWMKAHWRKVSIVGGPFRYEKQEHDKLTAAMKLFGLYGK